MDKVAILKNRILGSEFEHKFQYLYKEGIEAQKKRYCNAIDRFAEIFGVGRDLWIFSAPGRTELSGNHTDHQHGRVLAAAVTLDTLAIVSPRTDSLVAVHSEGFRPARLDLAELDIQAAETGSSTSLIRGIAADLTRLGWQVGGFDAYTISSVPSGSGLSSSAAFETLIGTIFSHLYNDGRIEAIQVAKTGQYAENNYFGKPCGLMDQTASSVGDVVAIDFADPASPLVTQIPCDFKSLGYALFVVDAGGSHADLTDEYPPIPGEMKQVAACFGQSVLRDVDPEAFNSQIKSLREKVSDRAILRAMHFFDENERVLQQVDALRKLDIAEYLRLMQASGDSSAVRLQNIYPSNNTGERSVLLALAVCQSLLAGRGAWRVHGGGFAGTVQALVPVADGPVFHEAIEAVFGQDTCTELFIRPAGGSLFLSGNEAVHA